MARQGISTAVLGGMVLATSLGILVVPLFFILLGRLDRKLARREAASRGDAPLGDPA